MALASITIENFKCIGDAVTIPIRPLTLLFGKNSSGKSTVLQALLYMRELFLRFHQGYLFDIRSGYRPLENIPIDLGDFPSLVHRHDLNRKIRIRLEFDLSYASKLKYNSAEIELVVSWDETQDIASVESYIYALNGEECFYALNDKGKSNHDKGQQLYPLNQWWGIGYSRHDGKHDEKGYRYFVNKNSSIVKEAKEDYMISSEFNEIMRGDELSYVREKLNGIRYLGPIREVPPRNYLVSQMYNESRWATGLEAWDALARDSELAEKVNRYAQKLALGYSFLQSDRSSLDWNNEGIANLRKICSSDEDRVEVDRLTKQVLKPLELLPRQHPILLQDENSGIEVHPLDVGFGISQVFPVLVGALDQGYHSPKMFAVEQPELHVHPSVQVGLGDLFIDGIQSPDRIMLIETHSEHLLLRLLRRVRETTRRSRYQTTESEQTDHELTPNDLSVIYVRLTPAGVKFTPLTVTNNGDFDAPWPEGFFEERESEWY